MLLVIISIINPTVPRTAVFILKPLDCIHRQEIAATVRYKDHTGKRHTLEMRPKEVHCVCPFLKGKPMNRGEFLELSESGHTAEAGLDFQGVDAARLTSFLVQTCKSRHYKVDEHAIEGGTILYLASESIGEKAYYLGKYEVTQVQWREVMGSNPSDFKGDDLPVEFVSWDDVQEFVRKLNEMEGTDKYRLPSEAEWGYAARAGTTTRYSFGNDESDLDDYAWYSGNSGDRSHPVGRKMPNRWGLYDMHGNVWEWVQDREHSDYDGAPTYGSPWESGSSVYRVNRGGGWTSSARNCRSAHRYNRYGAPACHILGFRLLQEL